MKKRILIKEKIKKEHGCTGYCVECIKKFKIIDDMASAEIPVEYWLLTLKNFSGSSKLKEEAEKYITNIKSKYEEGRSICLTGNQGTGKTMLSICILRAAIKNGFSVYYLTASDLLDKMTDFKNSYEIKNHVKNVDFLVIDEVDSRFFVSDSMKELFSSIFENIFRHRSQNMMPTIICTNETDMINVFRGQCVQSIKSLKSKYITTLMAAGQDFRKKNE